MSEDNLKIEWPKPEDLNNEELLRRFTRVFTTYDSPYAFTQLFEEILARLNRNDPSAATPPRLNLRLRTAMDFKGEMEYLDELMGED